MAGIPDSLEAAVDELLSRLDGPLHGGYCRSRCAKPRGDTIAGMSGKLDRIRSALEALSPTHLDVLDESHMHSRGLETHYKAVVVSDAFAGRRAVQRHQAVYAALGALMQEVHALALHTYTPGEWAAQGAVPDSPRCLGGSKHDRAATSR